MHTSIFTKHIWIFTGFFFATSVYVLTIYDKISNSQIENKSGVSEIMWMTLVDG